MADCAHQNHRSAHPAGQSKLVKLSDSKFRFEDPALDIRGLGVFNQTGKQMGSVEDLYIDPAMRKVRFLDVATRGFLGLGKKRFLIPVEVMVEIYEDGITVDQGRDKVSGSPLLGTKAVPEAADGRDV